MWLITIRMEVKWKVDMVDDGNENENDNQWSLMKKLMTSGRRLG